MQKLISFVILIVCLYCAGCSHTQKQNKSMVEIAGGLKFELLNPASFGGVMLLTQSAEIKYADATYDLLFYSEISQEEIIIVGLMANGTRLFSIKYDGVNIDSDGYSAILKQINPEEFLVSFQLSQWPMGKLRNAFEQSNICFNNGKCSFIEANDGLTRRLIKSDDVVVEIKFSELPGYLGEVEFYHKLDGYQLVVSTIDAERF